MSATGPQMAVRQFVVDGDDDGVRLDRWFRRHHPELPFTLISRLSRTGQVRIDGKRAKTGDRLSAGQTIRIPPIDPEIIDDAQRPLRGTAPLNDDENAFAQSLVIHADPAAFVLNKPPGLATQGGTGTTAHVDGLLGGLSSGTVRPRLVHRLDKDTSGVLLVARTPGSAAFFAKHFAGRRARKRYWALVMGVPDVADGIIELALAKQPGSGGEKMQVDGENGQPAKSRYRIIDKAGDRAAWVELTPYTGRTHQLRVHMAAIGHPIVGDGKYGGRDAFLTGAISRKMHLHARRLVIPHPAGDSIDVTAPLPDHFAHSLAQLGFTESDGDLPMDDGPPPAPPEIRKQAARAHAKQIRRERRGERRGERSTRSGGGPASARKPGKGPAPGGRRT